ncbi:MAG TPA: DinB family protein [Candidatus Sulfomarinibacteraceae bacterium]|nr:DinB family protein [Candidatus Sulfomarinibacteraceae bacterium]
MSNKKKDAIRRKLEQSRNATLEVAQELEREDWSHPVYSHDGGWNALHLLRHLTWAESGMLRLMQMIREGHEGVPPDFDIDRYNARGVSKLGDQMPADLMATMDHNRQELLQFLDDLGDDDWQKKGRHGSLRIMSIEEILHLIADHEAEHLADLRQALELGENR